MHILRAGAEQQWMLDGQNCVCEAVQLLIAALR